MTARKDFLNTATDPSEDRAGRLEFLAREIDRCRHEAADHGRANDESGAMEAQKNLRSFRSLAEAGQRGRIGYSPVIPPKRMDIPVFVLPNIKWSETYERRYPPGDLPYERFAVMSKGWVMIFEGTARDSWCADDYISSRSTGEWYRGFTFTATPRKGADVFDLVSQPHKLWNDEWLDRKLSLTTASLAFTALWHLFEAMDAQGGIAKATTSTATYTGPRDPGRFKLNHPVRIIDITKVRQHTSSIATGTGSPVAPHWRRGHWRTYKATGNRVWVRSAAIHGGPPPGSGPQLYRVGS